MSDITHPDTARVLRDVAAERTRQVEKGWTREHDDTHATHDLMTLAERRAHMVGNRGNGYYSRERLVEAVAMMVAAIEAMDRYDWQSKYDHLPSPGGAR